MAGSLDIGGLDSALGGRFLGTGIDLGVNGGMDAGGNDILQFYVIDPPDDRYIAGYSSTQVDGDSETVGPRLKDLNIPFSLYGLPIPITFGVRKLYSNIIWAVPLRENRRKAGGGSKGVAATTTTFEYYATYAVAFGYPGLPDAGDRKVIRVWADGTLIYDRRGTGQQKMPGFNFRFYDGSETQIADPLIEAREGIGVVPGHRGLMYMVIDNLPVKGWGDRPPAISVEIGDLTATAHSITNIQTNIWPPLVEDPTGDADQDVLFVDMALNYAFTLDSNDTGFHGRPVRVYDMTAGIIINTSRTNQGAGVGWIGNNTTTGLAAETTMYANSSQKASYIPWLGLLMGQSDFSSAGSAPFILMDPFSGVVTNWIGSTEEGIGPAYPEMGEFDLVGLASNHFPASVPHLDQLVPQIVYTAYASDTYILGRTIYNDTVMLKLDGITQILDMNWWSPTSYDSVTPGGAYQGYSDFFAVSGSTITRIVVAAGAKRTWMYPGHLIEGISEVLFITMPTGVNNIYYERADNALIVILDNGHVHKYDVATSAQVWTLTGAAVPTAHADNFWMNNSDSGFLTWRSFGQINELDLTFGTFSIFSVGSVDYFVASGSAIVDSDTKSVIGIGTGGFGSNGSGQTASMPDSVSRYFYDRVEDVRIQLADFIRGICIYAGYADADIVIDFEIDDMIDGAIILSNTSFRKIMDVVNTLYRIDMIESDGKIKFTRKAVGYTGTDFAIADGETLLPSPDTPTDPTFQFRRAEESVMPARINVRYIDKNLNYNWAMMTATRSTNAGTNESSNDMTYEVPIVMSASEAKALANRVMYYAWNSRMSFSFRLPPRYFKMEPGDVGTVDAMGLTFTMKAIEVTYNNDYSIGVKATSFLSDSAITIVGYSGTGYPQSIQPTMGAMAFIIDVPLMRAADDLNYAGAFPLYLGISPLVMTTAWGGGLISYSPGGIDYSILAQNVNEGFVGIVTSAPAVPDSVLSMDTFNTMTVVSRAGDVSLFTSATLAELQAGENTFAYGADGRWEIIQVETITDNGDNTFTLSNIYRACRGTDYAVDFHAAGDFLVLVNPDITALAGFTQDQTELSFNYKGVGLGQNEYTLVAKRTTLHGYGALPWVPTIPTIDRSLSALTGDLTIAWHRRDRVSGVLADGDGDTQVPLRTTEANSYKVTILRHPYLAFTWDGGPTWQSTTVEDTGVEFLVTGPVDTSATVTLTLTAAQISTALLYEYSGPDDMADPLSVFSDKSSQHVGTNFEDNEQIRDFGYPTEVAFKWLDIMIQQKTNLPTSTGYGPGRLVRVVIRDT